MPRTRSTITPAKAPKVAEASRLSSSQNQKQDASATLSPAPKRRNIPAQGNALGNRPPKNPSPEGAAQGWRIVKLEDVADIRSGNGFPIKYQGRTEGEFPFFKVGDISRNWQKGMITLTNGEHCLTQAEVKAIRAKTLPEGSVVFAKIGAAVALNRRAILGVESLVDNNVMALVPSAKTTSRFLFYFMCQVDLGTSTRGGAVPSLRRGDVADLEIPLPPLPEQRRIVARIEELFSRLDAGVAALRHAKAQLQRYRQSVLAAAVTGQLTQALREQKVAEASRLSSSPNDQRQDASATFPSESAENLLKRILEQRRERWNGNGKYNEPERPDVARMPEIPTSWKWARLDALCAIGSGMSVSKNRKHKNPVVVPYLRVANVQRGRLVLDEVKRMEIERDRLADLSLKAGDVLFNEGGDRDKLGRGWVWDGQIEPCITQNHVFRASPFDPEALLPRFLSHWGNIFGQQFFLDEGTQTTNLASINKGVLSSFPVPIPPIAEQHQIVAEVEARTTAIDHLEAELDRQISRASRLRQSILTKAFAGELTPPAAKIKSHVLAYAELLGAIGNEESDEEFIKALEELT